MKKRRVGRSEKDTTTIGTTAEVSDHRHAGSVSPARWLLLMAVIVTRGFPVGHVTDCVM